MKGKHYLSFTIFSIILIFLLFYLIEPVKAQVEYNWTIEGNTIYIDVPNKGKISQTPHTLRDFKNYPIVNFTSYFSTEQCFDFAFGFNTKKARVTEALYYKPHYKNITKSFSCNPPLWYNYTINPKHFWCWENITFTPNETYPDGVVTNLVFEHDFERYDLETNTAYWNVSYLVEWIDISDKFKIINYDFSNQNTWYIIKNITFQPGETKTIKPLIYVEPQLGRNKGKYDILIKRCEDTILDAITSEQYVHIDPWYNTSWDYRTNFSISNAVANTYGFEIEVNASDFTGFVCGGERWVDYDNTLLTFWRESCNSTPTSNITYFIKLDSAGTYNISLYTGNTTVASDLSNIQDASVGALGDDFDDASFNTTKWSNSSDSGPISESGGILNLSCGSGANLETRYYTSTVLVNAVLYAKQKIDNLDNTAGIQYHQFLMADTIPWYTQDFASIRPQDRDTDLVNYINKNDGTATSDDDTSDYQKNVWQNYKIVLKSGSYAEYWKNDSLRYNHTTNVPNEPLFVALSSETGGTATSHAWSTEYDYVFVGNLTTGITYSQGSEESQSTPDPNSPPTWSNNQTSYPANYDSSISWFNITWSDDSDTNGYNFSFIEINWTGTLTNYTTIRDGNVSYYTKLLGVGTYNFSFYANDSNNDWNHTPYWTITINKGDPTLKMGLFIDDVASNKTITYPEIANVSANETNSEDGDMNYTLWRDNIELINGSSVWNKTQLGNGTYTFKYNTSGGANWSSGEIKYYLFVNKGPTKVDIWINGTKNANVSEGIYENTVFNFTTKVNVSDLPINLTVNLTGFGTINGTTSIYNTTTFEPNSSVYNITAWSDGNANYSSSSSTFYLTIVSVGLGGGDSPVYTKEKENITTNETNLTYENNIITVEYPNRLVQVTALFMKGDWIGGYSAMIQSLGDNYYRWGNAGILNMILFKHITFVLIVSLIIDIIIKKSKILRKSGGVTKIFIYLILVPLIVLFISLFIPSV